RELQRAVHYIRADIPAQWGAFAEVRAVDGGDPGLVGHEVGQVTGGECARPRTQVAGVGQRRVGLEEGGDAALLIEAVEVKEVRTRPVPLRNHADIGRSRAQVEAATLIVE